MDQKQFLLSKFGHFNRLDFTERCEKAFDRTFGYERQLAETFQYRKVMLNGDCYAAGRYDCG
ncbi:DUF5712 family protein [Dyadobacter sp. CY347]|uniref:DUF5712 family protein n=1 Tax=Dyadobacter sp. CY347 TaxID=2909336 RepID=UPI0038D4DA97